MSPSHRSAVAVAVALGLAAGLAALLERAVPPRTPALEPKRVPTPAPVPSRPQPVPVPFVGRMKIPHDLEGASVDTGARTGLDGKSLDEIAELRLARVQAHARLGLFPPDYHPLRGPSRSIWQPITPGERWLGPTPYYVMNPYLLVVMACADHVTPLSLFCPEVEIVYENRRIEEVHRGDSARCFFDRAYDPPYADHPGTLRLVMVNAFDAGLRYAHVDRGRSQNVEPEATPHNVVNAPFSQPSLFHVGRYRVNNISPEDPKGWIRLTRRGAPTRIHVKLWRQRPTAVAAPADLVYEVHVLPPPR